MGCCQMDLSKMYHDISAQSGLDSHVLKDFVQQNDVFIETLKANLESLNPYEAADALSFWLALFHNCPGVGRTDGPLSGAGERWYL